MDAEHQAKTAAGDGQTAKTSPRSGMGSISDAAGPLLDALQSAAKAAATESPGDPKVIAAVRLGWVMREITEGWSLNPLPHDLMLDEAEQRQAQALALSTVLEELELPELDQAAVEKVTNALQRGPAQDAAGELEHHLAVSLTGTRARFATAYTVGGGLRGLVGDRSSPGDDASGAQEVKDLIGALDTLSSNLPSHAARGVANSLSEWSGSKEQQTPALIEAQVNLWREVIVGEKKGTELLEPDDYIAAAKQLEGKFWRRALASKWLWLAIAVAVVLFGLGVYVLFVAKGHPGKVAAGAAGVLAALGLTWKGIGGTLGNLVSKLEVPLWGAELDGAITDAITITKPRKRSSQPARGGYADRRGRAISQAQETRRGSRSPGPGRSEVMAEQAEQDQSERPDTGAPEDLPDEPGAEGGSESPAADTLPGAPAGDDSPVGDTDQHSSEAD